MNHAAAKKPASCTPSREPNWSWIRRPTRIRWFEKMNSSSRATQARHPNRNPRASAWLIASPRRSRLMRSVSEFETKEYKTRKKQGPCMQGPCRVRPDCRIAHPCRLRSAEARAARGRHVLVGQAGHTGAISRSRGAQGSSCRSTRSVGLTATPDYVAVRVGIRLKPERDALDLVVGIAAVRDDHRSASRIDVERLDIAALLVG